MSREPGRGPAAAAESLTDWLRRRTDRELVELLRRRPDLSLPAPADLATLASRIGVRTSVQRVVDSLDARTLTVLEAFALTGERGSALSLEAGTGLLRDVPDDALADALDELRNLAVVWGEGSRVHLVAAAYDAVGPYPAGLGRPARELLASVSDLAIAPVLRELGLAPSGQPRAGAAVAAVLEQPDMVCQLIAGSTPAEREVLDRLAAGPPIGIVRDALLPAEIAAGATPPHQLVRRALLVPIDPQTVELPREVGLALRGDRPLGDIAVLRPRVETTTRSAEELDRLGTTAVLAVVQRVETLGKLWSRSAPPSLRSGGVGVRELRRIARALDADEVTSALIVEVAAAAGLIGMTSSIEPVYLPTPPFDEWLARDTAHRWTMLTAAWLTMSRQPSLVGERDERDRLITVLSPDAERGTAASLRTHLLSLLADLPPGHAPTDTDAVLARLAWQAPRRAAAQRASAAAVLIEAERLGVTAAGGLTSYGRAFIAPPHGADGRSAAETTLRSALPTPVSDFLVQPDSTIVVPGPPTPELARDLALVADLESTGGANVYRITEASVRRALDVGRSADEVTQLFAAHSRTPVPQSLRYLIDDVARRHGLLRAGVATAYLRCDDESLLSTVVADRATDALGLRRIAPTVAIASVPVARLLEVLRDAGFAPAAESPDGLTLQPEAQSPRAPMRPPRRVHRPRVAPESPTHLAELVRRMRSGDQLTRLRSYVRPTGQEIPGLTTAATLGVVRSAIRNGERIWLGYVDAQGRPSQHTIVPISMAGGILRGQDESTKRLEAFALHHVTAVSRMHSAAAQDDSAADGGSDRSSDGTKPNGNDVEQPHHETR